MVTAYKRSGMGAKALVGMSTSAEIDALEAAKLIRSMIKAQQFYTSAGAPTTAVPYAGAICLDTTNLDLYICSDQSTPTWTKLTT